MRLLALVAGICGASALVAAAPQPVSKPRLDAAALAEKSLQRRVCDDMCAVALRSFAGSPNEGQRRAQCRNFMTRTVFVTPLM